MVWEYFSKIIKESILTIISTTLIISISGTVMSSSEESFIAVPIILLILPGFNDMLGDMITVFVARLNVHLVIGVIPLKFKWHEQLKEEFLGLLYTLLSSCGIVVLISFVYAILQDIPVVYPVQVILIIFIASIIIYLALFFVMLLLTITLLKRNKDPNNILVPFITTIADLITPIVILTLLNIIL